MLEENSLEEGQKRVKNVKMPPDLALSEKISGGIQQCRIIHLHASRINDVTESNVNINWDTGAVKEGQDGNIQSMIFLKLRDILSAVPLRKWHFS